MNKYKDLEIFGFSGKIGVGKNFVIEKVFLPMLSVKQTVVLAFADHFKVDVVAKDKIPYENAFHDKTEDSRVKLQHRGTEEGRYIYGENIWVDVIDAWVQTHYERGIRRIVITDVRFLNEIEYIKKMGGTIIRINAEDRNNTKLLQESMGDMSVYNKLKTHISETGLDNYTDFDYVIDNNKTNLNFFNDVRDIVVDINENNKLETVVFCDLDDTICHCYTYYIEVRNKVIIEAKNYIQALYHKEFEYAFIEILEFFERNLQTHHIYKERYAESMVKSFLNFEHMFIDGIDIDIASHNIFEIGMSVFNYNYKPLGDAINTIRQLNDRYKVVFVTVGTREEQVKKLAQLKLTDIDFEIFDHKDEFVFRNLCFKYRADKYYHIGDSVVRDIEPTLKLKFDAVIHIDSKLELDVIKISDNHYKINHISNIYKIDKFDEIYYI